MENRSVVHGWIRALCRVHLRDAPATTQDPPVGGSRIHCPEPSSDGNGTEQKTTRDEHAARNHKHSTFQEYRSREANIRSIHQYMQQSSSMPNLPRHAFVRITSQHNLYPVLMVRRYRPPPIPRCCLLLHHLSVTTTSLRVTPSTSSATRKN